MQISDDTPVLGRVSEEKIEFAANICEDIFYLSRISMYG